MTVGAETLRAALRAGLGTAGQWVIRERQRSVLARELGKIEAIGEWIDHRFEVTVYRDRPKARGEAMFSIGPDDDDRVSAAIADAYNRAGHDRGPLWSLPRPAAPARVELVDPRLVESPAAAIAELGGVLGAADVRARISRARIEVATDNIRVVTSNELDVEYRGTEVEVDCAVVSSGSRRLRLATPLRLRARRLADLALARNLTRALDALRAEAAADPVPPGVYDVIVSAAALDHAAAGGFGWLSPLVAQASGQLARQALSRYQPGQSIYGDVDRVGDPLTLISDGTLPYGWHSAPFAERGESVRRFSLIEAGVSADLALDAREAALRSRLPNGGVRNLVLRPGKRKRDDLATGQRPVLVATALAWIDSNPMSGDVAAELTLSRMPREKNKTARGGQIAGNLFDWLPRLRLGSARVATTTYRGPAWIGIPAVEVR